MGVMPGAPVEAPMPPQQQQQQQQQQLQPQQAAAAHARPSMQTTRGLNGGWQSESDIDDRRKMIVRIVQLLRQRKPDAPEEWLEKLPQMAKRLEESLYRSAPSFRAYNDPDTLRQRLQQLALSIGMKIKKMQRAQQEQT